MNRFVNNNHVFIGLGGELNFKCREKVDEKLDFFSDREIKTN